MRHRLVDARCAGLHSVASAVIFDWYGTLARFDDGGTSNYGRVLAEAGVRADPGLIDRYHTRWDGLGHFEHSVSRAAYLAWTKGRLEQLLAECGVAGEEHPALVEALVEADRATPMIAFDDVSAVLAELRERGYAIGICSNWGWDLEPFLEATGVAPLATAKVSSARAGCRKPHPAIYAAVLDALGVSAAEAVFVGDSWVPDVLGPIAAGMAAVHLCREQSASRPALVAGSTRVEHLEELLGLFETRPSPR